jgi:dockerin type I repeat protein
MIRQHFSRLAAASLSEVCVVLFVGLSLCTANRLVRAQHVDILVEQVDGRLVTGSADFDTDEWTLGRRVYSSEFDDDFAVDEPGFNALATGSPSLPIGSQALPGNMALAWDFLPMTIAPQKANLFYWNGLESDGSPGITLGDVQFGPPPEAGYTLGLFDKTGTAFTVSGGPVIVPGGVIDDTDGDGFLHRHRFVQLLDNDENSSTPPADGIYLFAMQLRMAGLANSKPIYMVFGTLGSSVAALDAAAVPWVEERVGSLIGLPGDYNSNGVVEAADYVLWRETLNSTTELAADGDMNGTVDARDYSVWRANFGATMSGTGSGTAGYDYEAPEGSAIGLALVAFVTVWARGRRGASGRRLRCRTYASTSRARPRDKP